MFKKLLFAVILVVLCTSPVQAQSSDSSNSQRYASTELPLSVAVALRRASKAREKEVKSNKAGARGQLKQAKGRDADFKPCEELSTPEVVTFARSQDFTNQIASEGEVDCVNVVNTAKQIEQLLELAE